MDLSILLPASFIAGLLFLRRRRYGYLLAPMYIVFLSLLMMALSAKVAAMSLSGVGAGPALVIIPAITAIAIMCAGLTLRSVQREKSTASLS